MIGLPDIGLALPSDAQAIADLSRREIEHGLRWSWTTGRVRRAIQDRETNVVVARDGDAICGFALMAYRSEDAHLLLLAVSPDWRRRGIGSALIVWLEETLRQAGIMRVQVEMRQANRVARAFYARLGFEPVNASRGYYQGVENALHLVKELDFSGA
ncbi:MAG: GNAT family N-acetyltransferase [Dokdonella sp.]